MIYASDIYKRLNMSKTTFFNKLYYYLPTIKSKTRKKIKLTLNETYYLLNCLSKYGIKNKNYFAKLEKQYMLKEKNKKIAVRNSIIKRHKNAKYIGKAAICIPNKQNDGFIFIKL